jgi:hypothetical protein
VWSMVHQQLQNMPLGRAADFREKLHKAWDAVPLTAINHTVCSLAERHKVVVKSKGKRMLTTHTRSSKGTKH